MSNIRQGGFKGPVYGVNPRHTSVAGQRCFPAIDTLPEPPSLVVICTPPAEVPRIVSAAGERGTRAAIVLTAGTPEGEGARLTENVLAASTASGIRVLGPNCIGLIVPGIGLNATFAHAMALAGPLAFVSQSGALCTAVLDWTIERGIGLSHLVSLGNCADVDLADVLDYLSAVPAVRGILLYIESIANGRKFMSAARAASRNKTVIAIKAGRFEAGAAAAATHTGALAGADDVFDAAFRRAGILRVFEIGDLFTAAEMVARSRPVYGNRLAIVTNGGGPGVMATDTLIAGGGTLAALRPHTVERLNESLPPTWSHANPVDIVGDAGPARYSDAVNAVIDDDQHDALLVINVPTALARGQDSARVVADLAKKSSRCVFAAWMGGEEATKAHAIFDSAGVPVFDSPGDAVNAFLQMSDYRKNQDLLMQTPDSILTHQLPDFDHAKRIVEQALADDCSHLPEHESKQLLAAFGIGVVESISARSIEEAVAAAERLGFPVAVKVWSNAISHKSDVGGVELNLSTPEAVASACNTIRARVASALPNASIQGFTVQKMASVKDTVEVIVGAKTDPIFGPVMVFGEGGTGVEVVRDSAVCLPPLNSVLAADLVSRTHVYRKLLGYRGRPAVDFNALYMCLIGAAQLVAEIPEVASFDINPLLIGPHGALAVDARVSLARSTGSGVARLAIRPYPRELEEFLVLTDGARVLARPIRPEDEAGHEEFFRRLRPEDVYFRFFGLVRAFPHSQLARYTQIDYDREMAFIAVGTEGPEAGRTLGVVRSVSNSQKTESEFAIIVRSDLKGHGLGRALLEKMIRYCRAEGQSAIVGRVFEANRAMLALARDLGFVRTGQPSHGELEIRLDLSDRARADAAIRKAQGSI
jgi:acetyltransferase